MTPGHVILFLGLALIFYVALCWEPPTGGPRT